MWKMGLATPENLLHPSPPKGKLPKKLTETAFCPIVGF